jgi:hypothetical protein
VLPSARKIRAESRVSLAALLRFLMPFMIDSGRGVGRVETNRVGLWAGATLTAAGAVSLADAALLARTRGIFTGGFLSAEHLDTWGERGLFAAVSLLSDAAVAGVVVMCALASARRLGLRTAPAALLAVCAAAGPVLIADVISYELLAYLGDSFDLALMFDLAGRSTRELLAVSAAHLVAPAILVGGAAAATALAVVWTHRNTSGAAIRRVCGPLIPLTVLVAGFAAHAWARTGSDVLDDVLRRKPTGRLFGALAEGLTDVDGDGYGILRRPRDPSWRDGAVYPYAIDLPGNGIDENGLAGDLPAIESDYVEDAAEPPRFAHRPDVILIVLESFRADAVGSTLNGKRVTPTFDALARDGRSARHAYSHNGYTTHSRRHIFTGSLAGVRGDKTLIDDFRLNGYETAYFSGQDESFGGDRLSIRPERADVFYDARQDVARRYSTFTSAGSLAVPYALVLERINAFLTTRDRTRPLFLYVNFHDTHFPYWHRDVKPLVTPTVVPQQDISPARRDELRHMYLNTAANIDAAIGDLLEDAREALGRAPAVIVTADHGESLFDEGFLGHGYAINEAQTRVPLIVHGLSVEIAEPFAQSSLRSLMWDALAPGRARTAAVARAHEPDVFQYLGTLERPRQIAFMGARGQRIYDFREARARVGNSTWKALADLTADDSAAIVELVRFWERLRLAAHRQQTSIEQH